MFNNVATSYGTLSGTSFTPYDFRPSSQGGQGPEDLYISINGKPHQVSLQWNCDTAVNCAAILTDPMRGMMSYASATAVEGNIVLTAFFNHQYSTMSILTEGKYGTNAWSSGPNALALFGTNPIVHDVPAAGCQICVAGKFNEQGGATCKNCPLGNYSTAQQSSCSYEKNSCPLGTYASGTAACHVCPVGRYNDVIGITSEARCKTCAIGTCSAAGSPSCSTCDALPDGNGEHSWESRVAGTLARIVDDYLQDYSSGGGPDTYPVDVLTTDQTIQKYGPMEDWDVGHLTNLKNVFYEKKNFNVDISKWDVSSVFNMDGRK